MPNKTKTKNKLIRTKSSSTKSGGEVIASGGFGCVFKPALACSDGKRKSNGVSKLMTLKHANDEYDEITQIKSKLIKIPDYAKYFLIDDIDQLCIPAKLTSSDLDNFQEKCSALQKSKYTAQNINNSLNELRVLSMPDGGVTIKEYIYKISDLTQIQELNRSLLELLKKGIIPMNNRGIYHSDIKDSNILVNGEGRYPRLIDWGLTTEYPEKGTSKNDPFSWPTKWNNKIIQFNLPFSVILFSGEFIDQYNEYIDEYGMPRKSDAANVDSFIADYLFYWMETGRGIGHISLINTIIEILYELNPENDNMVYIEKGLQNKHVFEVYEKTIEVITIYIRKILIKYTSSDPHYDSVSIDKYLNDVFIHNVDKWGFITTYLPFLRMSPKDNLDKYNHERVFSIVKDLFLFLYETSDRVITEQEINERLSYLNRLQPLLEGGYKKQTRFKLSNHKKTRKRK
jgi:serine/threonine protein kinase